MASVQSVFAEKGALAKAIEGFSPRQSQTDMALAVEKAVEESTTLVVEAGTGTGKTFAYLVPALLHSGKSAAQEKGSKKVIVSTGTRNLQDQLFHRDLPLVKQALAESSTIALLKGRSNYLCLHRLSQHSSHAPVDDKEIISALMEVRQWSSETKSGDIGDLTTVPEDSPVIPYVTSTTDNCLGKDCPDFEDCYVLKARKRAMNADVVVVNHHLFFADLGLKDTGFGELVPDADVVIFDEAHQIPELASEYFGESVSSRQIMDLCKDVRAEYQSQLRDMKQLEKAADKLEVTVQDFRLGFPFDPGRGNWRDQLKQPQIQQLLQRLNQDLQFLYDVLKLAVSRSDMIDHCFERCVKLQSRMDILSAPEKPGFSLWYDTTKRYVTLHLTPLTIADKFSEVMNQRKRSWIFTSATLAVEDNFDHYTSRMGIKKEQRLVLSSPFNYQQQALLCVPRYLPEPNDRNMSYTLAGIARQAIKSARGRCFILFTSHRMLTTVGDLLEGTVDYPILKQGSTSKRLLLEQFSRHGHAVLLGTSSFWEGVDVRGDALTCVIIDKLPFASPDDPLLQARMDDAKRQGGEPFAQIQLPQAVIALKQGVGRLIRDKTDRGTLIICDNRLVTKHYGSTFLKSLPPMYRTRDMNLVCDFLKQL